MEIDITKLDISGRGILKLLVAFIIVLAIFGVAAWLYTKAKGAVKTATPATVKETTGW